MFLELFITLVTEIITDPIKQYVVAPVKRHLGYAFKCDSNVERLQDEAEQLKNRKDRLQHSADLAARSGQEIYANVTNWLSRADGAIGEAEKIVRDKQQAKAKCFIGLCPAFKTRYRLSKKADKKASAIDKLRNEDGLDTVSYHTPSKQKVAPSVYSREGLPSRVSILKEVMDALKDPNLNIIGVYGMGGVGKTTLVKEVQRQSLADKLFDNVIMVVVSQTPDLRRIQAEIAEVLDLDLVKEGMLIRANILSERLKKEKILIIMDDIWQPLQLEEVGIPYGDDCKGCKLLLTSRRRDVLCSEMGAQKDFKLEVLPDAEAVSLFEMTADDAENPILQEIAQKCGGLPLLILRVATDLRNKDSSAWNDKLMQLSVFGDEEIQAKVHSVLESSYNNLPTNEVKSFFLLCGLFGQSNIRIQLLLMYSMGLGLFKHRATVEKIKDRVYKLINDLKAECLLLDGDMEGFVKMHDVVRDTAMSIASRVQHAFIGSSSFPLEELPDKNCTRISLPYNDIHELPQGLECPKAELLFLTTEDFSFNIPDSFFEGITKLKVLDFTGICFESLPSSLGFLTNLRTLCLHRGQLDNVAIVGELKQLEVLSFAESFIAYLPREIEQLTRLKLLELSNCSKLKVIPANVLSKLSLLEALYIRNSFVEWEAQGNARLSELEHLSLLTTLEMQVPDAKILPKSLFFNVKGLQNYRIVIGDVWDWSMNNESSRMLKLRLKTSIHLERGVLKLLKESEDLYLDEVRGIDNVLYDLDGDGFPKLKHLHVLNDPVIQHITNSTKWSPCPAFPILQSLFLDNLMNLEDIYLGQLAVDSFKKLKVLKVENCEKLLTLFSFSSSMREDYVNVESGENDDNNRVVELPQLCSLTLGNLPQLRSFCSNQRVSLKVELRRKQVTTFEESTSEGDQGAPFSLFNRLVSLPNLEDLQTYSICCGKIWQDHFCVPPSNLKSLIVKSCKNLRYLFTAPMVQSLVQLKKLEISGCSSMEEIILTEESIEDAETVTNIVFRNLDNLRLSNLPKLIRFCTRYRIEFQLLRELYISMCHAFSSFVPYSARADMTSTEEAKRVNSEANDTCEIHSLFNAMVELPNLEEMRLGYMDNLKNIWHSQLAPDSFCKLKSLLIDECPKLLTVFPPNGLPRFRCLEKLSVWDCDSLQEIFQLEELNVEDTNAVIAFKLRDLNIRELNKLKSIWSKDPRAFLTFQELKSIEVEDCEALKNIFPISIARCLLQLQSLNIMKCGVEELVTRTHKNAPLEVNFKFPQLISLKLENLPEIKSFYPGRHTTEWPKLKCLDVSRCKKALKFGSEISDCEQALGVGTGQDNTPFQPLFLLEKLNPNLEKLPLEQKDLKRIQNGQLPMDYFSKLKVLELRNLRDEYSSCFLSGFLKRLYNLEKLVVSYSSLKELFSDEKIDGEKEKFGTLVRLKHLEISEAYNLKHIWRHNAELEPVIQYLETLIIHSCASLNKIVQLSSSFGNLDTLEVSGCHKLKSLIALSTAKTMVQLTRMSVSSCNMMMELVLENNTDLAEDKIIFSKLKILQLQNLKGLISFCSGNYAFSFPVLEEVIVNECPKMKIFSGGILSTPKLRSIRQYKHSDKQFWEGNLNATIAYLVTDVFGTVFQLSKHPELKNNWHEKLLGRRFCKVQNLTVDACELLPKAITAHLLQYLNKLRRLEVRDCASVEELFDLEGMSTDEGHVGLLPQLRELLLINLPMLRHLWNKDPKGILDFKNLRFLKFQNCSSFKYAFTQTMALCLGKLKKLQLKNCRMMEGIIKFEEVDERKQSNTITFPSLNSIVLECLPNFSSFCLGSGDLECPTLKNISICDCPNVKIFFSTKQRPKSCDETEGTLDNRTLKVLSNLEELSLDSKSTKMILDCELPMEIYAKLKVVRLSSFPQKSCSFIFGFLQRLCSLEKFVINNSSLKELFYFEDAMILPRIRALESDGLDDLENIWNKNSQRQTQLFEHLNSLEVRSCGNLIDLAPSSVSFTNLTTLEIVECKKMVRLIPLAVAKSMVQLVTLNAEYCDMLMEIVGGEQDSTMEAIVFSKLRKLKLSDLHSLKSFCSYNHSFNFPSLEQVTISCCPNLGIFCPGDLRTPKLHSVVFSRYPLKSYWEGDLNSTIQQLHIKMVGFQGLGDFKLSKFPMLKENWHGQFPFENFKDTSSFVIDECASFSNAVPSNLMQYLSGKLVVEKCDSVEEVFDLEALNADEIDDVLMRWLNELHLIDLLRLSYVWNKDLRGILSFQNLRLLKVQNCGNLTHIFTLSVALGLENLKRIEVTKCSSVEQIITAGEEDKVQDEIIFPSLESMSLECLPSLLSFYSAEDVWRCPSLKKIDIVDCPHMNLFPSVFSKQQESSMIVEVKEEKICMDTFISPLFGGKVTMQGLEELRVEWNSIMHTWQNFQLEFFSGLKLLELKCLPGEFPIFPPDFQQNLTDLEIRIVVSDSFSKEIILHEVGNSQENSSIISLPELIVLVSSSVTFENLTVLEVSECHGLMNLLTASAAKSLVQLKRMDIKDCRTMKEIVAPEEGAEHYHEIEFSRLTFLGLRDLPLFTSFCSDNFIFDFPSLEEVIIRECPKMKTFATNVLNSPKLWRVQTGKHKYEWEWEGNLNNTIQALSMQMNAEETS